VEADNINELRTIIREFKLLKQWGLNINIGKSMVLARKQEFKIYKKIEGIQVKDCVKYLGINISFNKGFLKRSIKKQTTKNINNAVLTLRNVNSKVKTRIAKSVVEASLRYQIDPLKKCGIISDEEITQILTSHLKQYLALG
jgi:hypothetical protein